MKGSDDDRTVTEADVRRTQDWIFRATDELAEA